MADHASAFNVCRVDLGALAGNYKKISEYSKGPVMAVVKGDAYGHGLVPCALALEAAGCAHLGVLDVEEALTLKKAGAEADVTVLAGLLGPLQSLQAVEAGAVVLAYDLQQIKDLVKAAERLDTTARIRLKIDTGMGRLGVPLEKATYTLSNLATFKRLRIEGLATHLPVNGDEEAEEQLARFQELVEKTSGRLDSPLKGSVLASGGLLAHRSLPDQLNRVGLLLYGYSPLEADSPALKGLKKAKNLIKSLTPVMTVKTRLIQVREAKAGETIGYDRTYKARKTVKFGTAPIGYVHGLSRTRSGKGHALIGSSRAPLLGRVCMNLTMWDVSGLEAKPGDEVVILGRQGDMTIGADMAGAWQSTSAYETLCLLGRLNPREHFRGRGVPGRPAS